ncbi:MAG: hypothetical protein C4B59_02710 [Candidatus Methanogaster sp.]|uniref:Uncharacterized protein n=1 Tax=Candidatus Methanogaster sp. TaxID=3386292 RepID=A0AC61L602_9EURY|nr:MAG: hypothetical protein C4B59_02710 [ANME-2 cluster archaeon]
MKVDAAPGILNAWVGQCVANAWAPITTFTHHHAIIITIRWYWPSLIYFVCGVCGFTFQTDPNFIPITCPQYGG